MLRLIVVITPLWRLALGFTSRVGDGVRQNTKQVTTQLTGHHDARRGHPLLYGKRGDEARSEEAPSAASQIGGCC